MTRLDREILSRLRRLEGEVRLLRETLPPALRFQLVLDRMRARARGVSAKSIAGAAETAVRQARREARHRSA